MLLIDNGFGVIQQIGTEGDDLNVIFEDSKVYGETDALDCPY
jgi:pyruvate/2-oxoacid:ferredoxin oxidoreductase beta subunit